MLIFFYGSGHLAHNLLRSIAYEFLNYYATSTTKTQALWSESSHQEDYTFRSFHVLFAYVMRNEIATLLQPREHNLYTRHSETEGHASFSEAYLIQVYHDPHSSSERGS